VFHVLNRHDRPYTEDDDRIAAQLSDYWLEFMRTGDPNDHRLPRWQPAGAVGMAVMGLGDTAGMLPAVSSSERYEAFRDFVRDGGQLSLF
jgi:carboxylesterase type B